MRLDLGPSLAALKATLAAQIDHDAEAARQRFITPGAGQAMEYQATEAEARRYLIDPSGTFPFLAAEVQAQGSPATFASVAAEVVALADAWAAIGSEIKRLRRAAKLAVEAAPTASAARQAAQVTWPAPGVPNAAG